MIEDSEIVDAPNQSLEPTADRCTERLKDEWSE
jgi:hypothetical protein